MHGIRLPIIEHQMFYHTIYIDGTISLPVELALFLNGTLRLVERRVIRYVADA